MATVLAGLACAANLELTRRAPLLTTDSASYLSVAHNLNAGKGLTTSFNDSTSVYHPIQVIAFHGRVPFVHFEPLYPILLAGLHAAGLSYLSAARTIGVLSLAAIVFLLCGLAYRALQGYLPLVIVFVVVTVIGPSGKAFVSGNVLELSGEVLSEPLFYALFLGALLACAHYLEKRLLRYLIATVVLVALATLTRYVGVSLVVATCLAIVVARAAPIRERIGGVGMILAAGVAALAGWPLVEGWLSGGDSPRQIALHVHPQLVSDILSTAGPWFFPTGWPTWLTDSGALVLIGVAAIVPLSIDCFGLLKGRHGPPWRYSPSSGCAPSSSFRTWP